MAQQHFLDDQTCFDRLAETYVIGNQQVDASHVDRAHQRVQLEVLKAHSAAKRCLEKTAIGISSCSPAHGIEKGVQRIRVVLPSDRRQSSTLDDVRPRLDFPDDLELFAQCIFVD
ncbi:hypothetical protein D3C80_1528170 [compost metagenome]